MRPILDPLVRCPFHSPMPEDPRNRKTSGWSSSYQPFSFLRIAETVQVHAVMFIERNIKQEGPEGPGSLT